MKNNNYNYIKMEIGEIAGYIISALGGGGITQLINARINRKKVKVEVQQSEIDVIASTVRSVYEPIIKQQNERIDELNREVKQLRAEKQVMQENYERQIKSLQTQILSITRTLGIKATERLRGANGQYVKAEKKSEDQYTKTEKSTDDAAGA